MARVKVFKLQKVTIFALKTLQKVTKNKVKTM